METVGNGWKHDQAKTCPTRNTLKISVTAQRNFFLNVRRCARGNGWKQSEIAPLLGKKTGTYTVILYLQYTCVCVHNIYTYIYTYVVHIQIYLQYIEISQAHLHVDILEKTDISVTPWIPGPVPGWSSWSSTTGGKPRTCA